MLLNQVKLDCFAIHHHFDYAAAVERPPPLGDVHTAHDILDGGWILQGMAGALDLADVARVEGELAHLTVGFDEVDADEVAAGGFDQFADAGGLGHWAGARGLTVWLFLLPTTISHSSAFGAAIHTNSFRGWMNPIQGWGLRVSDTFTVQAYYTSQGGRLVRLRIANGSYYHSQ